VVGCGAASFPRPAPHRHGRGLVGGARGGVLGEAVLAHNGVLFLDEISEFARSAIQALRQPLEEGRIAIARARYAAVYPARFILIAATNPCPCGYAGGERCTCSESELARQRRRLSGPLLERIDLVAHMREPGTAGADAPPLSSSALAREQVAAARERQASRLAREPESLNGHLGPSALARHLLAEPRAEEMVRHAAEAGLLSARGAHRVMRVARTIADLAPASACVRRTSGLRSRCARRRRSHEPRDCTRSPTGERGGRMPSVHRSQPAAGKPRRRARPLLG